MPTEEVGVLGGLRTFLAGAASLAGTDILMYYPDALPNQTKTLLRLELVEVTPRDWIGSVGPATATPGKVDKTTQQLFMVRIEVWARRVNNPGGKSEQQVAIEALTAARQRLAQNKGALLAATGLHYQTVGSTRTLPHDANFPDWMKVALWFSAYKDETWLETP